MQRVSSNRRRTVSGNDNTEQHFYFLFTGSVAMYKLQKKKEEGKHHYTEVRLASKRIDLPFGLPTTGIVPSPWSSILDVAVYIQATITRIYWSPENCTRPLVWSMITTHREPENPTTFPYIHFTTATRRTTFLKNVPHRRHRSTAYSNIRMSQFRRSTPRGLRKRIPLDLE